LQYQRRQATETAGENSKAKNRRLFWTIFLNAAISVAEMTGGVMANSLALISDSLHNLSDVLTSVIAWAANKIGNRKSTLNRTFGYKRIEILAASLNSLILIAISAYLVFEAVSRFGSRNEIRGMIVFIVATIGFLANFMGVVLLKRDSAGSLNIRAAYLHFLGDALASLAVIFGGILIWIFRINWIDPVVTIIISIYIFYEAYKILRQTNDILMQGTPPGIDLVMVKRDIEMFPEIANIHHIHAWIMSESEIHFECHVDLRENLTVTDTEAISGKVREMLRKKYGIHHTTIQFEHDTCHDKNLISH
jgi:cobalt-zinc-cadmium efflux system protein